VIAPYILGELDAIRYIDDAGLVWDLEPENAQLSATFTASELCYPTDDCSGNWYLPIRYSVGHVLARPRDVIRTLPGVLQTRADDVVGKDLAVLSCLRLADGICAPTFSRITAVPCPSLRVVEVGPPDLGAIPPLHLERR